MNVLTVLCLPLLTAACATTEVRTVGVPAALLADCEKPKWEGGSYRDLAELAMRRGKAIDDCNDQLAAVREYQRRTSK